MSFLAFYSHNERRTQWEDPRLQMMGISRPIEHSGALPPHHLAQQPPYNTGGPLNHHHAASHQQMYSQFQQQMRQINQSLDHTHIMGADDHRHLHPLISHQYPQQPQPYGAPMHRPMSSVPAPMNHFGALHQPLQSKRSFDLTMMDHHGTKVPVTLQGDPYLNDHARQASHDSGLGYPYQSDQNLMDFEEGFDGGLHQLGSNPGLVQDQTLPGQTAHGLMDPLHGTPELDHHHQMEFGSDMLGDFTANQNMFGNNTWV